MTGQHTGAAGGAALRHGLHLIDNLPRTDQQDQPVRIDTAEFHPNEAEHMGRQQATISPASVLRRNDANAGQFHFPRSAIAHQLERERLGPIAQPRWLHHIELNRRSCARGFVGRRDQPERCRGRGRRKKGQAT